MLCCCAVVMYCCAAMCFALLCCCVLLCCVVLGVCSCAPVLYLSPPEFLECCLLFHPLILPQPLHHRTHHCRHNTRARGGKGGACVLYTVCSVCFVLCVQCSVCVLLLVHSVPCYAPVPCCAAVPCCAVLCRVLCCTVMS